MQKKYFNFGVLLLFAFASVKAYSGDLIAKKAQRPEIRQLADGSARTRASEGGRSAHGGDGEKNLKLGGGRTQKTSFESPRPLPLGENFPEDKPPAPSARPSSSPEPLFSTARPSALEPMALASVPSFQGGGSSAFSSVHPFSAEPLVQSSVTASKKRASPLPPLPVFVGGVAPAAVAPPAIPPALPLPPVPPLGAAGRVAPAAAPAVIPQAPPPPPVPGTRLLNVVLRAATTAKTKISNLWASMQPTGKTAPTVVGAPPPQLIAPASTTRIQPGAILVPPTPQQVSPATEEIKKAVADIDEQMEESWRGAFLHSDSEEDEVDTLFDRRLINPRTKWNYKGPAGGWSGGGTGDVWVRGAPVEERSFPLAGELVGETKQDQERNTLEKAIHYDISLDGGGETFSQAGVHLNDVLMLLKQWKNNAEITFSKEAAINEKLKVILDSIGDSSVDHFIRGLEKEDTSLGIETKDTTVSLIPKTIKSAGSGEEIEPWKMGTVSSSSIAWMPHKDLDHEMLFSKAVGSREKSKQEKWTGSDSSEDELAPIQKQQRPRTKGPLLTRSRSAEQILFREKNSSPVLKGEEEPEDIGPVTRAPSPIVAEEGLGLSLLFKEPEEEWPVSRLVELLKRTLGEDELRALAAREDRNALPNAIMEAFEGKEEFEEKARLAIEKSTEIRNLILKGEDQPPREKMPSALPTVVSKRDEWARPANLEELEAIRPYYSGHMLAAPAQEEIFSPVEPDLFESTDESDTWVSAKSTSSVGRDLLERAQEDHRAFVLGVGELDPRFGEVDSTAHQDPSRYDEEGYLLPLSRDEDRWSLDSDDDDAPYPFTTSTPLKGTASKERMLLPRTKILLPLTFGEKMDKFKAKFKFSKKEKLSQAEKFEQRKKKEEEESLALDAGLGQKTSQPPRKKLSFLASFVKPKKEKAPPPKSIREQLAEQRAREEAASSSQDRDILPSGPLMSSLPTREDLFKKFETMGKKKVQAAFLALKNNPHFFLENDIKKQKRLLALLAKADSLEKVNIQAEITRLETEKEEEGQSSAMLLAQMKKWLDQQESDDELDARSSSPSSVGSSEKSEPEGLNRSKSRRSSGAGSSFSEGE